MKEPEATLSPSLPDVLRSWTRLDWLFMTLITLAGGAVRFINVGSPPDLVFDETYYAKDACWYITSDEKICGTGGEITMVHPPLGKWLIAIGIRLSGYNGFGWRIASVVAGTITIALLYILAKKILQSSLGAVLASGLLAIDFLHFVESRISMLDIFVPLFGVAAILFVALDRDRLIAAALLRAPPDGAPPGDEVEDQDAEDAASSGLGEAGASEAVPGGTGAAEDDRARPAPASPLEVSNGAPKLEAPVDDPGEGPSEPWVAGAPRENSPGSDDDPVAAGETETKESLAAQDVDDDSPEDAATAEGGRRGFGLLERPWRLAAGLAGGAAMASKWSGALVLVTVIILTIAWELGARRRDGQGRVIRRTIREEGLSILLWLVVAPIAIYAFTYIGRIYGFIWGWPWSEGSWIRNLWERQLYMEGFHRHLAANHAYQSPPWSWILIKRPVSYFYCGGSTCNPPIPDGYVQEIFAAGNPFVWWCSILALLVVAGKWVRTRNFAGPEGLIIGGFVLNYGPWILLAAKRPAVFLFYLLPVIPFMCLALAWVGVKVKDSIEGKAAIGLFVSAAVALTIFYYPLLAKTSLPYDDWNKRMWIFRHCEKPPGDPITTRVTVTPTNRKRPKMKKTVIEDSSSLPPTGWCWI